MSDTNNSNASGRKPHNYWNDLTPEQQAEREKLDKMRAEVKKNEKIAEDNRIFNDPRLYNALEGNNGNGNNKKKGKKDKAKDTEKIKQPRTYFAYKYSTDIPLAEEIILGNQSVFLQIIDGYPILKRELEILEKNIIIKPHERSELSPILPYGFKDVEEIKHFIEQANKESIHSLYKKSKSLLKTFVVAKDNDTITLLALDQVYSYFQDLFPYTHYDNITGIAGSGKGAILTYMKLVAYRVLVASNTSGANLLDIYGSNEPCQITLAEDEFDHIEKDPFKEIIIKVGVDREGVCPRTLDGNTSNRHEQYYYVYGFKLLAAENKLDSKRLGGLIDRCFQIESVKSKPKLDVKTVSAEMEKSIERQKPKYRDIIARINYLRKLLLIFRILHHEDIIEEPELNIDGRARQLTSPQISLFNSNTLNPDNSKPALREVLKSLSRFLQKKGELTKTTLDGVIYRALEKELFPSLTPRPIMDVDSNTRYLYTISHNDIIAKMIELTDGIPSTIPNEQAFYTVEHDKITYNKIYKICRERFEGYNDALGTGGSKQRALTFDKEFVEKVGTTFEIISEIKILASSSYSDEGDNLEGWEDWKG
jgi:hypothetical protein